MANIKVVMGRLTEIAAMSHHANEDQLLEAIETGDLERVRRLASSGVGLNVVLLSKTRRESTTVLGTAAYEGQTDILLLLVDELSVPVNVQDPLQQRNALHWACMGGHVSAVRALVDRKADVNCADRDNVTPIIRAAITGRRDIVSVLVDHGADVRRLDRLRSSALHYATFYGKADVVALLVRAGCVTNNATVFGQGTPLANLVYHGDVDNVRLLLAAGYDLCCDGWVLQYNFCHEAMVNDAAVDDVGAYILYRYRNPPALSHLCRRVIRNQMYGVCVERKIFSLPLPLKLNKYLALEQLDE